MKYQFVYTEKARADLHSMDNQTAERIVRKLDFYLNQPNPVVFSKPLTNSLIGHYRFRIGNYRVIFDKDNLGNVIILTILRIRHRSVAYL